MQWVSWCRWLAVVWTLAGWHGVAGWVEAQWIETLSEEVRSCMLWSADHEEGTLYDWQYDDEHDAGGGIFNTGEEDEVEAAASPDVAHSGQFAAKAMISNAIRAMNGSRAVRLMRWTDRPWSLGGQFFPVEAYYSAWIYFPRAYNPNKRPPWDPGDGGWWNVFQFKAYDAFGESQPMWILNVGFDEASGEMEFYLFSPPNVPGSYLQEAPIPVPIGQWVHVEMFYRYSHRPGAGALAVWQDGELIFEVQGVKTALVPEGGPVWGLGNYTDHISGDEAEGTATLYFDDAVVGLRRALSTEPGPACERQVESP